MLRERLLRILQWMHITILLSLIFPVLYCICIERDDTTQRIVYLCALSIFIPVVLTDVAIRKIKQMMIYFAISAGILFGSGGLVWGITHTQNFPEAIRDAYFVLTLAEVLFLIFDRFFWRLNLIERKQKREVKDISWRPRNNHANKPTLLGLAAFFLAYIMGKNFDSPILCNQALFSGMVYFLIFVLATYIEKTEEYLIIRKNTCHLPRKRIYGISSCMVAAFLCLMLAAMVPSVATIPNRSYRDYRDYTLENELEEDPFELSEEELKKKYIDPVEEAKKRLKKMNKAPWWENLLFYSIGLIIFFALAVAAVRLFFTTLHNFSAEMDENGDQVEALEQEDVVEKTKPAVWKRKPRNERERIRFAYKKWIKTHHKQQPRGSETPTELEQAAGVVELPDAQEFHERYEWARYAEDKKDN